MAMDTIPYASCESYHSEGDITFAIKVPDINKLTLPNEGDVLSHFTTPEILFCFIATGVVLTFFRPRLKRRLLGFVVSAGWLAIGLMLVAIITGNHVLPAFAEGLWQLEKKEWALVLIDEGTELSRKVSSKVKNRIVRNWADDIERTYRYFYSKALVEAVNGRNWEEAQKLADKTSRDYLTIPFIEASYLHLAEQSLPLDGYSSESYRLPMSFARRAFRLRNDDLASDAMNTIHAHQAWTSITGNELDKGKRILEQIPSDWADPNYPSLIDVLQSKYSARFAENVSLSALEKTISITEDLLWARKRSYMGQGVSIPCNLAILLELRALSAMKQGDSALAINALETSKSLVDTSPTTVQLMPLAYYQRGLAYMENGQAIQAVSAFKNAYQLDQSEKLACVIADALRVTALDYNDRFKFTLARDSLKEANQYCASDTQTSRYTAEVNFQEGLYFMCYGRWSDARDSFRKVLRDNELGRKAGYYVTDTYLAKRRDKDLKAARSLGNVPDWSGQYCVEFTSSNDGPFKCTALKLFNGSREVGRSSDVQGDELGSAIFGNSWRYRAYLDSNGDGKLDTWRSVTADVQLERIDTSGDYRPDWERSVSDGYKSLKPLSGRVSVRIVGGVVGKKGIDWFSRPDIYLGVWKNQSYLGRTETADNTTRPNWNQYFVIDYKYGDSVTIAAFDEDLFSDEYVDKIDLHDLPATDYWITESKYMALQAIVTPSKQPEGRYNSALNDAKGNVFDDDSFLVEESDLGSIVRASYQEDARAEITSFVAAIAIPEIAIATAMKRANTASKFIAAWVGFDVVLDSLSEPSTLH
jgi:tetratricopeptide (TPR) repeat protein